MLYPYSYRLICCFSLGSLVSWQFYSFVCEGCERERNAISFPAFFFSLASSAESGVGCVCTPVLYGMYRHACMYLHP